MAKLLVDFDLAHGPIDFLKFQSLERYFLGDEKVKRLVIVHEVDLACVSGDLP